MLILGACNNRERCYTLTFFSLAALGGIERLLLFFNLPVSDKPCCEALNVARSVALNGAIANPFSYQSGLTAHLSPVMPWIVGHVYRFSGVQSQRSETILLVVAYVFVVMTAFSLLKASALLSYRRGGLLAAGLFFVASPFRKLEIDQFRIWEGALAVCLSSIILWFVIYIDKKQSFKLSWSLLLGFIAGFTFLVSPPVGLAAGAAIFVLLLRRVAYTKLIKAALLTMIAAGAVLTPWTVRNYGVFGAILPVRSDAGLELALSFNSTRASNMPRGKMFFALLERYHPAFNRQNFEKMQRSGGERRYAQTLGAEAKKWIINNPSKSVSIFANNITEYFFVAPWMYDVTRPPSEPIKMRAYLYWTVPALGLIGILYALAVCRGAFIYPALMVIVTALPYSLVFPTVRYSYLDYPILLFSAVIGLTELTSKLFSPLKSLSGPRGIG